MSADEKRRADNMERTKTKWRRIGIKWWEFNDPKMLAYYQLQEEVLLVPFGRFHAGTEALLGRLVYTHEFAEPQELLEEFETKKPASFIRVMEKLARYGKPIIGVISPSTESGVA